MEFLIETWKLNRSSEQIVWVTVKAEDTNRALIRLFGKPNGTWAEIRILNGFVGLNGVTADKKEGDDKTPTGAFALDIAFGVGSNPGTRMPYRQMKHDDVWVDDPASALYNTLQQLPAEGRWLSAEVMVRNDHLYDYGIVIGYNTEAPVPGAGSAIFLHISETPTAGCVGMGREDLLQLLFWLDPVKNPVIVITPE